MRTGRIFFSKNSSCSRGGSAAPSGCRIRTRPTAGRKKDRIGLLSPRQEGSRQTFRQGGRYNFAEYNCPSRPTQMNYLLMGSRKAVLTGRGAATRITKRAEGPEWKPQHRYVRASVRAWPPFPTI